MPTPRTRTYSPLLALFLCLTLLHSQDQSPPSKLNLVIVGGDNAVNNVRQRTGREPIVQVEDENHKPIAGVAVTFTLPNVGATGTFSNGSHFVTVLTDASGRASAGAFQPNSVTGAFKISVTASHQGQTATTAISQTNSAAAASAGGMSAAAKIGIIAGLGAGAAVGVAVGLGGKKSPAPTPTPIVPGLSISLGGGPVFGPPK